MSNAVFVGNSPLITEIVTLTERGMTDSQIGKRLGKHYKTIAYHRSKQGIDSGRSHKATLTEQSRTQAVHKRTYKMNSIPAQEQSPRGRIKHGLNAYAPITCKGAACPYRGTCNVSGDHLGVGEPCVTETALIATLTERYCRELQVGTDNIAGLTRIKHLIEIEIKLMRCNRLMALNPELFYTIWEDERHRRKLNPIARYDLLLMREYSKVLSCLR